MPDIDINDLEGFDTIAPDERAKVIATLKQKGYRITGLDTPAVHALSARGGYNAGPVMPDVPALAPPLQMQEDPWPGRAKKVAPLVEEGSAIAGDALTGGLMGGLPGAGMGALTGMAMRGALAGGAKLAGMSPAPERALDSAQNAANLIPTGAIRNPALRAGAEGFSRFLASKMDGGGNLEASLNGMFAAAPSAAAGFAGFLKGKGAKFAEKQQELVDKIKGLAGGEYSPEFQKSMQEVADSAPLIKAATPNVADQQKLAELAQKAKDPGKRIGAYQKMDAVQSRLDKAATAKQSLDDLQARTGLDPRKMDPDQWKAAEEIGRTAPEVYYNKVVGDLFAHDNLADLNEKGKKAFQSSMDSIIRVSGLEKAAVRQGVRKAFMDRILGDVDTTAGILKNPDTLRYRLKAMGPDIVNQVFSNSSDPRREAGGAYDTFMELTNAASRETGTRKMRVFLTENGASIISLLPALGRVAGAPLGRDAENSVKGRLKDAGIAALAGGMTSLPTAPAVAAVAGPEVLSYTWQQLIEKAGNRNSKLGAAIRVLADTEGKYSSTAVQKAYEILRENASEKKQLNNDPNRTIRVAP